MTPATRLLLIANLAWCGLSAQTGQSDFFEQKIRPVFVKSCQGCHNAKLKSAGLDLSSADGFAHGGGSGALIAAGDHTQSLLLRVVSYDENLKMPPMGKLKPEDLANLDAWVKDGAKWPGAPEAKAIRPAAPAGREITAADRQFWAFQPLSQPAPPKVRYEAWVRSVIDRFLLAKMEKKGVQPAAPADKVTLLRRATFDLTGLPPTAQELQDFVADRSPGAFTKVVDRLLASPRYGEQWGRHWLDLARYADSTGNDEDHRYPYAWRYRDYVIDAFNRDLPYDQFVREQLAGDLLPGTDPGGINRRGIVATGFLALGPKAIAQQDKQKMLYDVYDEQIEVTSRAFMGLTVQCARCHDHKFDPIRAKDYYSMAAVFANTKSFRNPETHVSSLLFTPLVPKPDYERYQIAQDRVTRQNLQVEDLIGREMDQLLAPQFPRLADYMVAAREVYADKKDAAAVAKTRELDEKLLAKWIEFLKPSPEARPHLAKWHAASAENSAELAKTYQAQWLAQYQKWQDSLGKWRKEVAETAAAGKMAPSRPKLAEDEERFFQETYFHGPFNVGKKEQDAALSASGKEQVTALRAEAKRLKEALPPEPDMACAVQEEPKPVAQKLFLRGDYNNLGPDTPQAFPAVLSKGPEQTPTVKGSGRRELAEWLTQPEHPLTARVMVNRIWLGHFGDGLVRTPDNFGKMGERPTHPELLDFLARQFMDNGWSVKKMHRLLLLSSAYQMSSVPVAEAVQRDPENRLFSRFQRRRLSVEELRDSLLAADKTLDTAMGGTLQTGFGTDGENSNGRLSISPDTVKRRTVYIPLRRANLPSLLNLFDFGDAATSQGKRPMTTVAPQALFMMNSSFITERARNLAKSVMDEKSLDPHSRVRRLFVQVLNREPDGPEVDTALTYLASFQQKFAPVRSELDAWMSYSRILIGSNEFIYVE